MPIRILFQGDSVTDAGRIRENPTNLGAGYPHLLGAHLGFEYGTKYECLNRGIAGSRTKDVIKRAPTDIFDLNPDVISLLIGVNDSWIGDNSRTGTDTSLYVEDLESLLDLIKQNLPKTKIILLEPFIVKGSLTATDQEHPGRWETCSVDVYAHAEAARKTAQKYHLPFVELQSEFNKAISSSGDAAHWVYDGVHPAPAGHELIKREWLKAFEEIK